MRGFVYNDVVWSLDPLKKFKHVGAQELRNYLGFIPSFITLDTDNVELEAIKRYGYNLGPMTGEKISKEGVHSYPGDPDLYPLSRCEVNDTVVYVYQYGVIAFRTKEATTVYRFD